MENIIYIITATALLVALYIFQKKREKILLASKEHEIELIKNTSDIHKMYANRYSTKILELKKENDALKLKLLELQSLPGKPIDIVSKDCISKADMEIVMNFLKARGFLIKSPIPLSVLPVFEVEAILQMVLDGQFTSFYDNYKMMLGENREKSLQNNLNNENNK